MYNVETTRNSPPTPDERIAWLRRTTWIAIALAATTASAVRPDPLDAQGPERPELFGSISLRHIPNSVVEFSQEICPEGELVAELRAGWRVIRWIVLSAGAAVHRERSEECVNGLVPPPPDSGTVVGFDYSSVAGYPYASATIRAAAEGRASRGLLVRAFGGLEWLPGKSVVGLTAGAGLGLLIGPDVVIALEVERRQLTIPHDRVTVEYRNAMPVQITRDPRERVEVQGAVRLGLEVPIGGRRY